MDDTKEYILQELKHLQTEKERYLQDMREACSYTKHRTWERNSTVKDITVHNATPIDAMNTAVHGISGYMLSPSIRWFKIVTKGENFEESDSLYKANDWLEYVMNIMYSLFNNSRFYPSTLEAIKDAFITGTSYEMITDKVKSSKIIYDPLSPFECYIAENEDGEVDTFFREYTMTARQAYKTFGEKLPYEVKRFITDSGVRNPNAECKFIHAIYPRDNYTEGEFVPATQKKWASVHYSYIGDEVIKESGYDEFPLAVHRWKKTSNSPYGMGLVMEYLPEIKRLNDLTKQYSVAVQFQASPTMVVPENLRGRFTFRPGYTNYANTAQTGKVEAISNQLNINYLAQQITDLEQRLQRLFYADLFNILMRQERERTAYEVQELKGEGLILLSAIIGNMQVEKLNPLVLRTFRIMLKDGVLPPPPPALVKASKSGRVEIELDGPLAQTMKQHHQATGLQQGLASIASVAQIFPDELAQFDGGEIARQFATAQGLPQSCIREKLDVQKIKEQQAKAQAEKAQQEAALAQSQIYKNMGYNASTVPGTVPEAAGGVM